MKRKYLVIRGIGLILLIVAAILFLSANETSYKDNIKKLTTFYEDIRYTSDSKGNPRTCGCRILKDGTMEEFDTERPTTFKLQGVKLSDEEMQKLKELSEKVESTIVHHNNCFVIMGHAYESHRGALYSSDGKISLGSSMDVCSYNPTAFEFLEYVQELYNKYIPNGNYICGEHYYENSREPFILGMVKKDSKILYKTLSISEDGEILEYSMYDKVEDFKRAKIDNLELHKFSREVVYETIIPNYGYENIIFIEELFDFDSDSYVLIYSSPNRINREQGGWNGIYKYVPIGESLELSEDEKKIVNFYAEQYKKLIPDGEFVEFFESIK